MQVLWSWGYPCPWWALQLDLANKGCSLGNSCLKIIPPVSADLLLKLITKKNPIALKIINKKSLKSLHLPNKSDSNQKLGVWSLTGVKVRRTPLASVPVENSDQFLLMVWCVDMKCSHRCWHKVTPRWPPHASLGVWHILDLASSDREALCVGTLSLVLPLLHTVAHSWAIKSPLGHTLIFFPTQTYPAKLQTLCFLPSGNMKMVLNVHNLYFSF